VDIKALRREYASRSLDDGTVQDEPLQQFRTWFDEALRSEILDANAMALATVSAAGVPSVRTVLLKDIDARGLVFFTHYNSPKGTDLVTNPQASVLFYWAPLERQVRVSGQIERLPAAASDAYFASRPRDSQIAAWAAPQSSELPDRATLERRYEQMRVKYDGQSVPRPPDWGGYRLVPDRVEFWQGRPKRLHDRVVYVREQDEWRRARLAP
jgi:pyridoxamine 5'-phosphate oxidase